MRILTTAILSAGLMLGSAGIAQAQFGALKDAAKKAATDAAKNKVLGKQKAPAPEGLSTPLGNVSTGALGNSGLGSISSTDLSTDESITAGKILLGGGSTTDVARKIGTDRAKAQGKDLLNGQVNSAAQSFGSGTNYETAPEAAPETAPVQAPALALNCPAGTKAQPDGTCMLTE